MRSFVVEKQSPQIKALSKLIFLLMWCAWIDSQSLYKVFVEF